MNSIKIEIQGTYKTGKTTLAKAIGEILKGFGLNVQILDPDIEFTKSWNDKDLRQRLSSISKNTGVIIETKQMRRQ